MLLCPATQNRRPTSIGSEQGLCVTIDPGPGDGRGTVLWKQAQQSATHILQLQERGDGGEVTDRAPFDGAHGGGVM